MSVIPRPTISVSVDVTNPGQYFACCGLLELADRACPGAVGWFDDSGLFHLTLDGGSFSAADLLGLLRECGLRNTMTDAELDELKRLKSKRVKELSESEKAEKKLLESKWRESPLLLGAPFNLRLDWFHDSHAGGNRFKTWAGQQSVIDIASAMHHPIVGAAYDDVVVSDWLVYPHGHSLTFNFDSDASAQGAALDVGFSLDPLGMSSNARPLLELMSFVALQRFRPAAVAGENRYIYATWNRPLLSNAAALVTAGFADSLVAHRFAFPLLYRTKYLKSFLPATPIGHD